VLKLRQQLENEGVIVCAGLNEQKTSIVKLLAFFNTAMNMGVRKFKFKPVNYLNLSFMNLFSTEK